MSLLVEQYATGFAEKARSEIAEKLIDAGKMALQEIADCTGLSLSAVSQLAIQLKADGGH